MKHSKELNKWLKDINPNIIINIIGNPNIIINIIDNQ